MTEHAKGKELFTCSGCIGKWCETDTTMCVPDTSLFESGEARDAIILSNLENQWIKDTGTQNAKEKTHNEAH